MAIEFERVVESIMELPLDQQEMLQELISKWRIEARRLEIAHDAQESLAMFRAGQLKSHPAQAILADLRQSLSTEE